MASPVKASTAVFRAAHPWPRELQRLGTPIEWLWSFEVPVEPRVVWPIVADTAKMNRAAGLGAMHYREVGGVLHGWHRTGGVRHEFIEKWEWVCPSKIELTRDYQTGFARFMRCIYLLEEAPGGSRLQLYLGWVPRGVLGPLAVRVGMKAYEARFRQILARVARSIRELPIEEILAVPAARLDGARQQRIDELRQEVLAAGGDLAAVDKLVALVKGGDETELERIRIKALARKWEIDARQALVAALHATRAGLLELTWDVVCPHCRGAREKLASLGDVPRRSSCGACAIEFGTDEDNAIEVSFRVHPSIQAPSDAVYCSAQPMRRAHIRLQQELPPGEVREVETALGPGVYRLRRRGERQGARLEVVEGAEPHPHLQWDAERLPEASEVGPAPVLELAAAPAESTTFVVEEMEWDRDILKPAHLFGLQEFRDLFSEQYLAAGVQLNVGEQTVLFTDIVGSTAFYARVGDPTAFVAVKQHFGAVYEQVKAEGGVVVKTIGDAVMAAFPEPVAALRAAHRIHQCFRGGDSVDGHGLRLRASLNTGPCIAVNLNSGIDYFGGTVNAAAKLQAAAGAGEVALSQSVARAPGALRVLETLGGPRRDAVVDHQALGAISVTVWTPIFDDQTTSPNV